MTSHVILNLCKRVAYHRSHYHLPHFTDDVRARAVVTLVMGWACPWCSLHSPGSVSGNFIERSVPSCVPTNSMRPECDMTTAVSTTSPESTLRRIWCGGKVNSWQRRLSLYIYILK